jgi:hypothetical protein
MPFSTSVTIENTLVSTLLIILVSTAVNFLASSSEIRRYPSATETFESKASFNPVTRFCGTAFNCNYLSRFFSSSVTISNTPTSTEAITWSENLFSN